MTTVNGAFTAKATAKATFDGHKLVSGFPNHNLNVKVELLLNATWTDITKYVLVRDDISIGAFGRTNEASSVDSAQLTLTLKNTDGRFTPDNTAGAYYPYVQLNTQIRVNVNDGSVTGVTYNGYRFWGEVSEWPPQWDVTGRDVYCAITASGIWRRLSQRTKTLGSPYTRFNNFLNPVYNLAGYWPMEDGQGSQYFATTTSATSGNMTISGPPVNVPTLASVSQFPGSNALPTLNAAELDATVTTSSHPGTNQLRFCLFVPVGGDTGRGVGGGVIARMHTSGTVATVDVAFGSGAAGGPLTITGKNIGGTTLFTGSSTLNIWGNPMLVLVSLAQVGGNITWAMNTIYPGGTTWNTTVTNTISTATVDDATSVIFNPGGTYNTVSVGQASLYYGNPGIQVTSQALNGWVNENALTRFTRICAEEGIPSDSIGTAPTTTMGFQADDTLVNVLQEIEDTDGGALYETRSQFGLGYRTMASLQNQSSALTLNYAAQQVGQPLAPVNDDAMVRNDITLTSNYDGYAVRVYLANGARSLNNPPNGVGTGYEYGRTVNGTNHTQVNNLGIQLLNNGTFATSRYPVITANLARVTTSALFSQIPSMRIGDFLTITNMPAFGGPATQKQLVWGWTETINNKTWTFAFNTSPEDPWESSFNPGTSFTGQVPALPTTQGTGAGSVGSVTSAQIVEGAIIGANIAQGAVQGGNIANASITATNIANATITGSLIANGSITGTQIASATIAGSNIINGTITSTQIATATITGSNIQNATITGANIGSGTVTGTNIGSATIAGSNMVNNTITATQIQNAAITSTQISATAGITGSQLANGTITATQIANATITGSQISATAGITGSQIAGGTITAGNITNATITNTQIAAGSITGSNIGSGTITGANLTNATITSVQIANGTITTTQISNSAGITGSQLSSTAGITAGQVSFTASAIGGLGASIQSTTPTSPHTGDLWFDTSNGTVLKQYNGTSFVAFQYGTGAIAANSITSSLIAANTIIAADIAANTITAGQIAAGTITATQIAANTITASQIAASTITATQIAANTITAGKLVGGIVVAGIVDATTITGSTLVLNGANGQFLIYSGTPASGNLIGSWSGFGGTDSFGNSYPSGLSVNQGVITGIDIDSVTITNATLQGDILQGSSISQPTISGGTMTETDIVFDSTGGQLLVYTSSTTVVTQSTAGNYTWTVPTGVTTAQIEVWAAGAGGDGGTTSAGGRGGGGGGYGAELNYSVTPAATLSMTVGAGGAGNNTAGGNGGDGTSSFFDIGGQGVYASPGLGNGNAGIGQGNSINHSGGTGGTSGVNTGGSSGGNSGNINANGNNGVNATSSTGAAAPATQTGSGRGGAGGNNAANGSNATAPGAGGGGAGKGTLSNTKTVSYSPLYTGSYYGPDATNGNPNGLRSSTTMYQGGETASGGAANGNQRTVFGFNRTLIASDFSGYTVTSCTITMTNLHSWYSSGMYIEFDEFAGLPGTIPSSYPGGNYTVSPANAHTGEGETHSFTLAASVGQRFVTGTDNGLGIGHSINTDNPYNLGYYGYFSNNITFTITGTIAGAGSETAGNGADGQVKITYTSGQTLAAAISPVAGTDIYGNSFVAGGSFQNLQLFGTSTPATPPSNSAILYNSTGGTPSFITSTGYSAQIPGSSSNVGTTRTATTTGTNLTAAYTIPANDANVGTVYRITAWGSGVWTTSTILQWEIAAFGSNNSAAQFNSMPGNFFWRATAEIAVVTTGSTGTAWFATECAISTTNGGSAAPNTTSGLSGGFPGTVQTVNTASATSMAIQLVKTSTGTGWSVTSYWSTFERLGP